MFLLNLLKLAELRATALFDIKDEVNRTHPMTCTYLADANADIELGSSLANGGGLNSRLTARQIAASRLLIELGQYSRLLFTFDESILRIHNSKSEEYLKYFNAFETREFNLIESLNNYSAYIDESLLRPFALNLIKDNATPIDPYDLDITHPMVEAGNAIGANKESINITEMWLAKAQSQGKIYMEAWRKAGYDPTIANIGFYVEGYFSNNQIYNSRREVIDRATIVREALTGITTRNKGYKSKLPKIPDGKAGQLPQK